MNAPVDLHALEVGFDVPAAIGMDESEIQTPCLVLDLDALERNIRKMGDYARAHGIRHRAHAKMHKSVDVARLQVRLGGAVGVCCQKVSEAEVFARAGIEDVLVSNQVRDPLKLDRLARLPHLGARTIVCVDDVRNVAELSAAARKHGTEIECLVEIDCGAGRCGVGSVDAAIGIARAIDAAPGLVSGGGTGSYCFEAGSGVYNELQCGSYAFMDADYGRILDEDGNRIDRGEWENALFILTSVMSHARADRAICDAGLKAQSVDSGLPVVFGRDDVKYVTCSDEHGVIEDPTGVLEINDRLRLVPGHCDPTCNVHDWYVGVRGGKVETVWPVSARGKAY